MSVESYSAKRRASGIRYASEKVRAKYEKPSGEDKKSSKSSSKKKSSSSSVRPSKIVNIGQLAPAYQKRLSDAGYDVKTGVRTSTPSKKTSKPSVIGLDPRLQGKSATEVRAILESGYTPVTQKVSRPSIITDSTSPESPYIKYAKEIEAYSRMGGFDLPGEQVDVTVGDTTLGVKRSVGEGRTRTYTPKESYEQTMFGIPKPPTTAQPKVITTETGIGGLTTFAPPMSIQEKVFGTTPFGLALGTAGLGFSMATPKERGLKELQPKFIKGKAIPPGMYQISPYKEPKRIAGAGIGVKPTGKTEPKWWQGKNYTMQGLYDEAIKRGYSVNDAKDIMWDTKEGEEKTQKLIHGEVPGAYSQPFRKKLGTIQLSKEEIEKYAPSWLGSEREMMTKRASVITKYNNLMNAEINKAEELNKKIEGAYTGLEPYMQKQSVVQDLPLALSTFGQLGKKSQISGEVVEPMIYVNTEAEQKFAQNTLKDVKGWERDLKDIQDRSKELNRVVIGTVDYLDRSDIVEANRRNQEDETNWFKKAWGGFSRSFAGGARDIVQIPVEYVREGLKPASEQMIMPSGGYLGSMIRPLEISFGSTLTRENGKIVTSPRAGSGLLQGATIVVGGVGGKLLAPVVGKIGGAVAGKVGSTVTKYTPGFVQKGVSAVSKIIPPVVKTVARKSVLPVVGTSLIVAPEVPQVLMGKKTFAEASESIGGTVGSLALLGSGMWGVSKAIPSPSILSKQRPAVQSAIKSSLQKQKTVFTPFEQLQIQDISKRFSLARSRAGVPSPLTQVRTPVQKIESYLKPVSPKTALGGLATSEDLVALQLNIGRPLTIAEREALLFTEKRFATIPKFRRAKDLQTRSSIFERLSSQEQKTILLEGGKEVDAVVLKLLRESPTDKLLKVLSDSKLLKSKKGSVAFPGTGGRGDFLPTTPFDELIPSAPKFPKTTFKKPSPVMKPQKVTSVKSANGLVVRKVGRIKTTPSFLTEKPALISTRATAKGVSLVLPMALAGASVLPVSTYGAMETPKIKTGIQTLTEGGAMDITKLITGVQPVTKPTPVVEPTPKVIVPSIALPGLDIGISPPSSIFAPTTPPPPIALPPTIPPPIPPFIPGFGLPKGVGKKGKAGFGTKAWIVRNPIRDIWKGFGTMKKGAKKTKQFTFKFDFGKKIKGLI